MNGCRSNWWLPDVSGEANGGQRQHLADASAGHQRQMVGGGVKWQGSAGLCRAMEASGRHLSQRQLVGC